MNLKQEGCYRGSIRVVFARQSEVARGYPLGTPPVATLKQNMNKNKNAVALGKKGGIARGKLPKEKLSAIGKKAVRAREAKKLNK